MRRFIIAAAALLAAGCATAPQQQVEAPAPRNARLDEMITQQTFCGMLFAGFLNVSDDNPEDQQLFSKLLDASSVNIAALTGGDRYHPAYRRGIDAANYFIPRASTEQIIAAGDRCVALITEGK